LELLLNNFPESNLGKQKTKGSFSIYLRNLRTSSAWSISSSAWNPRPSVADVIRLETKSSSLQVAYMFQRRVSVESRAMENRFKLKVTHETDNKTF
jgi:hypothetical protein